MDAHLAAEILANVLHELDHVFARVDDPIGKDDRVSSDHVLRLDLLWFLGVVVHRLGEGLEHAASDRVATAHEGDYESLALVGEAVALRGLAFDGGEVEAFDAESKRNVLGREIPPGVVVCLLQFQTVHVDVAGAGS